MNPNLPAELLPLIRRARRVVALTGAGISAESGVPTFREAQTGLWARFDPAQLATPEAFAQDPRLVSLLSGINLGRCVKGVAGPGTEGL